MIRIEDVLTSTPESLRDYRGQPEMDPLTEDDALQEAQILDLRLDAITGTLGILVELRTALQLRESNTGVLVAHGLRQFHWHAPPRESGRTAWTVGGSTVDNRHGLFRLSLGLWPAPGAQLTLVAASAAFVTGDVPDLLAAPPDYGGQSDHEIREQLATWGSPFQPASAVFLETSLGAS